jgi:HAMP domain-containing protein
MAPAPDADNEQGEKAMSDQDYEPVGPFRGSLVKYDQDDFVALVNSQYGWAVSGQCDSILNGADPEDQNSNALRYIMEFARRKGEPELAEYLQNYLNTIGYKMSSKRPRIAVNASLKPQSKKYARVRRVADTEAPAAAEGLEQLAQAFGALGDSVQALRENLDLVQDPGVETPLKERIATARRFAKNFKKVVANDPAMLEGALNEVYHSVDEVASALENYADNLGIALSDTAPVEEAPMDAPPPVPNNDEIEAEEGQAEEKDELPEEKEATSGPDAFSSDRDADGHPKEAGTGSDNFVTNRDDKGDSKQPFRVEVPAI